MASRCNWWIEIENVDNDIITDIKDALGYPESEDKDGNITGQPNIGKGIVYAVMAIWMKGKYNNKIINNLKVRAPI